LTPERQNELRSRIDQRFDQFSLDELRAADSGAMTFGISFPELSISEREFAEQYFDLKIAELRRGDCPEVR
jgi:hypothetical protein